MKNEMSIIVEDTPVIKYMPQGKVNGRYVTTRARHMDMLEDLKFRAHVMNVILVFGSVLMTAIILVSVLYLVG